MNGEPNWEEELGKLNAGTEFFQPKARTPYEITFLDFGGPLYTKSFEGGEAKERKDFKVRVSGGQYLNNELTWTLSVGGKKGLYGMLLCVFASWAKAKKSMVGGVVHISCDGEKRERKYVVQEFANLLFQTSFSP